MLQKTFIFLVLLLWVGPFALSQTQIRKINWEDGPYINHVRAFGEEPKFFETIPIPFLNGSAKLKLLNAHYEQVNEAEQELFNQFSLKTEIGIRTEIRKTDQKTFLFYELVPLRLNPISSKIEKLISFDIDIQIKPESFVTSDFSFKPESVLASGRWFKIRISGDGAYKISRSDLEAMGMNVNTIDPRNLRIYGNGGGMLREKNNETRFDDLMENAIQVIGEDDGKFDAEDYILFYGQSPHIWKFDESTKTYSHIKHAYSDFTYYFINADLGPGKRLLQQESINTAPTFIVNEFEDHAFHEIDEVNLINSGRNWYGEVFDANISKTFKFKFPNIVKTRGVNLVVKVAARSSVESLFELNVDGVSLNQIRVPGINFSASYPPYAQTANIKNSFFSTGENVDIILNYNKPNPAALGWLDKIEMTAWRKLIYANQQMHFRNSESVSNGRISKFVMSGANGLLKVWNITDPMNVKQINYNINGSDLEFTLSTDSLLEFLVFDENNLQNPEFVEEISNQNYHAIEAVDLIIICPNEFYEQAARLAQYHLLQDGLTYFIARPNEIYNEFSSGAQDISAIRNFVRMLYKKAPTGSKPKYLLLFGDASFDYKDRINENTNFVPTWESDFSTAIITSYNTDDYFGLLDPNEGENVLGSLDIGIGRIPVRTSEQARQMVDKIIHYSSNSESVMGSWRNKVSLIADDQDYNAYINDSEKIASIIEKDFSPINIDKIYFDAFQQIATPGGQRYPDAKKAINDEIEKGSLLINYIGHGGETGWAHERVLEIQDINAWQNFNRLPVFITATCEFTRFDDPERESAGELVLLNEKGGGIALLTTTRATSAGANFQLNQQVIQHIFYDSAKDDLRLGDIIKNAKNNIGNGINAQKFVLVGDPALRITLPHDSIATLRINKRLISENPDTITAMTNVEIAGSVYKDGSKNQAFNGHLYPVVYDKSTRIKTFGQDDDSFEQEFDIQSNILFKGKVSIVNGDFSFSFVVPKDIAYNYGFGKISYYAQSQDVDAWGSYDNLIIGGYHDELLTDNEGPQIKLFLNDEFFENGDVSNSEPFLFAQINDESGINTSGSGIGHDIIAVLDNNQEQTFVLNDFFEPNLNSHKSGTIKYPMGLLDEGWHVLKLKVWDIINNSSEAQIEFEVINAGNIFVSGLMNFPNPVKDLTYFKFKHNQAQSAFQLEIQIFSMEGKKIKSIYKIIEPGGFSSGNIQWDVTSDSGERLKAGIYLYRILINGEVQGASIGQKLIIVN